MDNSTLLTALLTGGGGATLIKFLHWAISLWATIRREELAAAKLSTEAAIADRTRIVDALLAQAKSNAELGGAIERANATLVGKIEGLSIKLDTIHDWKERTPVEGVPVTRDPPSETRRRTAAEQSRGYRSPNKPGNEE